MKTSTLTVAIAGALLALSSPSAFADPHWDKIAKRDINVFHTGVTPIEFMTKKSEHSGSVGLRKGETCIGCHEEKGTLNFDFKRLAGKELEPIGAPKTMMFPVSMQAAYDDDELYSRLTFKPPTDPTWLYISAMPVDMPALHSEAFIRYSERALIWAYVKKYGVMPSCNRK